MSLKHYNHVVITGFLALLLWSFVKLFPMIVILVLVFFFGVRTSWLYFGLGINLTWIFYLDR